MNLYNRKQTIRSNKDRGNSLLPHYTNWWFLATTALAALAVVNADITKSMDAQGEEDPVTGEQTVPEAFGSPEEANAAPGQDGAEKGKDGEQEALVQGLNYFGCFDKTEVSVEKISDRAFFVSYIGQIGEEKPKADALFIVDGEIEAFMRD